MYLDNTTGQITDYIPENHPIIIYDGKCSFCNYWVQFVLKKDKKAVFYFLDSQKEMAKEILSTFEVIELPSQTVIVFYKDQLFLFSDAVLFVLEKLEYKLRYIGYLIPKTIRDGIYKWVARHRYKITFWNKECIIPDENQKKRFL